MLFSLPRLPLQLVLSELSPTDRQQLPLVCRGWRDGLLAEPSLSEQLTVKLAALPAPGRWQQYLAARGRHVVHLLLSGPATGFTEGDHVALMGCFSPQSLRTLALHECLHEALLAGLPRFAAALRRLRLSSAVTQPGYSWMSWSWNTSRGQPGFPDRTRIPVDVPDLVPDFAEEAASLRMLSELQLGALCYVEDWEWSEPLASLTALQRLTLAAQVGRHIHADVPEMHVAPASLAHLSRLTFLHLSGRNKASMRLPSRTMPADILPSGEVVGQHPQALVVMGEGLIGLTALCELAIEGLIENLPEGDSLHRSDTWPTQPVLETHASGVAQPPCHQCVPAGLLSCVLLTCLPACLPWHLRRANADIWTASSLTRLLLRNTVHPYDPWGSGGLERLRPPAADSMHLPALLTLAIHGCELLEGLPEALAALTQLTALALTNAWLAQDEGDRLSCLCRLQELDLSGSEMNFNRILPPLSTLTALRVLRLDDCLLRGLPEHGPYANLEPPQLQALSLAGNELRDCPAGLLLRQCTRLHTLDLSCCHTMPLSQELVELADRRLRTLYACPSVDYSRQGVSAHDALQCLFRGLKPSNLTVLHQLLAVADARPLQLTLNSTYALDHP